MDASFFYIIAGSSIQKRSESFISMLLLKNNVSVVVELLKYPNINNTRIACRVQPARTSGTSTSTISCGVLFYWW